MSSYLLDTVVFLWIMLTPSELNREAAALIASTENELFLSAASAWEISIKAFSGKLRLPEPASSYVPKRLRSEGIRPLQISQLHALSAGELPLHHKDPFDRLLIAQAMTEKMVLLSADRHFEKYHVETVWCGR